MTRKSYGFRQRFPFAGLFLVIAVAVAIPLTVWSLNNVSTITNQQAQTPKCGANNLNPTCPTGFTCRYVSNNPLFGGTCVLESLSTPANLTIATNCKYNASNPNDATIILNWDKVDNATGYTLYGNYYYLNQGKLVNVMLSPYTTSNNSYTLTIPVPKEVKQLYWHIKAANSVFKVVGPASEAVSSALNCN